MNIYDKLDIIADNSHFWNWQPDLYLLKEIYSKFPNSYSLLTPFLYSYLEELIRSNTTQYAKELIDENGNEVRRDVGYNLIKLAKKENEENKEFINELNKVKKYFKDSTALDSGNNRNSTQHGYMHPRFWTQESFEELVDDIANFSRFANF